MANLSVIARHTLRDLRCVICEQPPTYDRDASANDPSDAASRPYTRAQRQRISDYVGTRKGSRVCPKTALAPRLAIEVPGVAPANFPLVSRMLKPETAAPAAARSSRPSWALAHRLVLLRVDSSSFSFCGNSLTILIKLVSVAVRNVYGDDHVSVN